MRNTIFDTQAGTASLGGNGNYDFLPTLTDATVAADAPLAIAEMADLFGVTHRTLHFYEEKGLISPHRLGAMRVYGVDCIRRMSIISACREMGLSLASIQELMLQIADAQTQQEADLLFKTALETRKRELASELSTLHRQLQQIRTFTDGVSHGIPRKDECLPALTDQERDCLLLLTEGYKGAPLAERLGISGTQLIDLEEQLITKLGVANRYQAAAKALILGILTH